MGRYEEEQVWESMQREEVMDSALSTLSSPTHQPGSWIYESETQENNLATDPDF